MIHHRILLAAIACSSDGCVTIRDGRIFSGGFQCAVDVPSYIKAKIRIKDLQELKNYNSFEEGPREGRLRINGVSVTVFSCETKTPDKRYLGCLTWWNPLLFFRVRRILSTKMRLTWDRWGKGVIYYDVD